MKNRHGSLCFSWMVTLALIAGICLAQQPPPAPPSDPSQDKEVAQAAKPKPEDSNTPGGQSLIDDMFWNPQHNVGFALGMYEAYTSNVFASPQQAQSAPFSAFVPRTFFNFGRHKSQFHLDFGGDYRIYTTDRALDSFDYYGNARYSLQLAKHTSFEISDYVASSKNDYGSTISPIFTPIESQGLSSEVLFNRQRITRNGLTGDISYATAATHFSVFGGYQAYRYQDTPIGNADSFETGVELDHRIAKWLFLSNNFTVNLYNGSQPFLNTRLYRFRVGGLDFRINRFWRIWAGGGAEFADYPSGSAVVGNYQGSRHWGESVTAGTSFTSRKSTLSFAYDRGFSSATGLSRLFHSDMFNVNLGHRITQRLNARLQSSYYKNSQFGGTGTLNTFWGGGSLEYALRRDLVASANYVYQNQHARNIPFNGLSLNRSIVYVGLQYIWPGVRQ